jgi:foldase protein PrsA
MARRSAVVVVGLVGLLSAGCVGGRLGGVGTVAPGGPLVAESAPEPDLPPLARAQLPEPPPALPPKQAVGPKPAMVLPPPSPGTLPAGNPVLPVSNTVGAERAAVLLEGSDLRVKVRAWVNGRPIFEEELMQVIGPFLREAAKLAEPQRSEKMAELYTQGIDQLVDQEVMYQDAVKKLEKNNPKALQKLREMSDQDYDKQVRKMRDAGIPEDHIKEIEHIARRMMERGLISTEYARNIIIPYVQQQVTLEQIQAYYDAHKNEFQTVDKVQWQDVFIATGPKYPTTADAKRFAEDLIAKCRTPEDFTKLLAYDDGDSKFRGGAGFGEKRGEIRPPELEPYLFELKDGQIGPVVELSTGVHVFRLVKREYAGQLPMNDQTQKTIRKKLEGQIAEREYKQLVRDLRSRSVVRIAD